MCVHAQTYELASQREDFVKIIVKKQEYKEILNEIFTYGKSLKLRKLMRSRNE
ncbi:conserved hypothetical protein [Metallosphaera cuprina Ar-4]|uniref:Uncharacterized protein n=1 Tax=Metallosphaera cuprina (strain Ar-4) TaxID=1006006 RepID=F4G255_METCR|nr:conserved hypothetical protein [Metallosphaera cuprina Ar-4]